jgi:hypothetical protein
MSSDAPPNVSSPVRSDQAAKLVEELQAAFPAVTLSPESVEKYTSFLKDLPYEETADTLDEITASSTRFPTIADIRRPIIEAAIGIPTPEEAYASIFEKGELYPLVKVVRDRLGGPYAFRAADEPGLLRHNFLKAYEEARERELRDANARSFRRAA